MTDEMSWRAFTAAKVKGSQANIQQLRYNLAQKDLGNALARRDLQPGERGFVEGHSKQQSWRQWVGDKIRGGPLIANSRSSESITLFPGWAARRYTEAPEADTLESFGIEVFVAGYAVRLRGADSLTRAQRGFLRLAKGFAALPKLGSHNPNEPAKPTLSRSTEDLLAQVNLPPRPEEISDDFEMEALESQFRHMREQEDSDNDDDGGPNPPSYTLTAAGASTSSLSSQASSLKIDAKRLHENLESRLQPFWSSSLSNRVVRLSLYATPHRSGTHGSSSDDFDHGPVYTTDITTTADGSFTHQFTIPWSQLCTHTGALHIAFGETNQEHQLLAQADLLPAVEYRGGQPVIPVQHESVQVSVKIPLTHAQVRVISDIDDTVKMSNILSGARAVFHNVFVKELREIVIPGMGNWYNEMWKRGVRFHYVSNGPFELLPVINEFLEVSRLPPGSIKLKSYAGRSLFNGLLSAPATRKRAGVFDILRSFPDSKFVLIGDSGEQDLELYASLAKESPWQILAIFIRDAGAHDPDSLLDDPTGHRILEEGPYGTAVPILASSRIAQQAEDSSNQGYFRTDSPAPMATVVEQPKLRRGITELAAARLNEVKPISQINAMYSTPNSSSSSLSSLSRVLPGRKTSTELAALSPAERQRYDLQTRLWTARTQVPAHIPLRIFRQPDECVEVYPLLDRLLPLPATDS